MTVQSAPAPVVSPTPAAEAPRPVPKAPVTPAEDDAAPVSDADRVTGPAPQSDNSPAPPSEVQRNLEPPIGFLDETPPLHQTGRYDDFDDAASSFSHEPMFRTRRNPARAWTIAAALFAGVSLGLVGATAWYGLPDWMPFAHPLFAEEQLGLKLDFPAREQDRHQLPDGTWYFGASGTVTNVSQTARSVPMVLIVLRDASNRVVYNAEVQSPKRVLAPGESVSINEALVQVPKSAVKAEFGWKPA